VNAIQFVLPSAHLSSQRERQIDRFSRFGPDDRRVPVLYNGTLLFPLKIAPSYLGMWTPSKTVVTCAIYCMQFVAGVLK